MPLTPLAPLAGDASPARLGWLAHQLSRLRIRTRITALMLLAALVAALLAALGIRGLAASKESLRVVYEDRMTPVRNL
ncbi:MAG: Tar ligand binding domain-containing protein, partial [Comamonadaceae bacterium]|nr:Tar ligand binding domain-containing protein [Comamonadaceae bacterium]